MVPRLHSIGQRAQLRLDQLSAMHSLADLMVVRGNRLEKLRGRWSGYYSVRINDQWRIVFRWQDKACHEVRIVDYH